MTPRPPHSPRTRRRRRRGAFSTWAWLTAPALIVLLPTTLLAASAGGGPVMPWTAPLQTLLNDLSGPTARVLGALAFVIGGAMWAFTRHEEGARRFGQAIVGIAIMIGAANIVALLGFAGAVV